MDGLWTEVCGQQNSQTTPATTSTSSICQLLGAADAQTAHHATFSTAPAHQLLGSANAETTPAGAPAAAADRKQRPDATCKGRTSECPGPRKGATTRRNVTGGGGAGLLLTTQHHWGWGLKSHTIHPPPLGGGVHVSPPPKRLGQIFFHAFGQSKFSSSAPIALDKTCSLAPLAHHNFSTTLGVGGWGTGAGSLPPL